MVRCIVKNCENNCRTCTPEQANFHKLPDNKIIREGWFRSIGEVILPSNIVNARICSVHFTPESFIQSKRKRGENILKRRLLPTAVPTLHLVTTNEQAHDKGNVNCNIVKRTFNLVCPSTSPVEPINAASLSPVPGPSKERISSVEPELSSLLRSSTPISRMMTEPFLDLDLLDKADMTGQHETPTTSVSCRFQFSLSSADTSHTGEQSTSRSVQSAQTTSTSTSVKNMTLSTPNSELRLHSFNENFTDATVVEDNFKCADDNLQEEITLTQELFKNIINITCDELLEDSVHERDNDRSDNLEILDEDVCENENEENDLWNFMQCGFKIQHQEKEPVSCTNSSDIVQTAGLQYVAGYVAHRFISKYPFLGERTINITDNSRTEECDWVKTVSKGYLIHPSEELMNLSKVVDECFVAFHGEGFSTEDYVIRKVVSLVKNSGYDSNWVPEEVLQCLVRTRTYIRVKEINKKENTRKEEKRKTKKLKN
ncbi:uncharacterized protein [Temnothorax nylanderi]|uniref:uncharacterized protein n=1 Tax=Temnothorax nylanderi TaxID=102681 RepID=UPI003A866D8E